MTAEEVAEIERRSKDSGEDKDGGAVQTVTAKTGTKRKSDSNSTAPNKKARTAPETPDEEEDDDAEEDS